MTNNERFPGNDICNTAMIAPGVIIGKGNYIGPYCIIGYPPEWKGKEEIYGKVVIGDNNRLTGHVTIDSGAEHNTQISDNCYLMKGVYIAHDCVLSNGVTMASGARIGGHTVIAEGCNLGINASVHQRSIIPTGCMIGMGAVITKKTVMAPYRKYAGNPARDIGSNINHSGIPIIERRQML